MIHWAHASVLHGSCISWTKMSTHKEHFNTKTDILPLSFGLGTSLLKDVVAHCMSCTTYMRAGVYEDTNVQLLTLSSEKRAAAGSLKRFIIQLTCFWEKLMCIQCQQHSMFTTFALSLCLANDMHVLSQINHSCVCSKTTLKSKCCRPFEVVGAICTPSE